MATLTDELKTELGTQTTHQSTEPVTEAVQSVEDAEKQAQTNDNADWFGGFSKEFQDIKDKDSLKEILNNRQEFLNIQNKNKEYEERLAKFDEVQKQNEDLRKRVNPRSHFHNDTIYRMNEMLKKNPDKDPSMMAKLSVLDASSLSDMDAAILGFQLDNPVFDGNKAKNLLLRSLRIDGENQEDWSETDKDLLKLEAEKAKKRINDLKNIEVPGDVDYDNLAQEEVAKEQARVEKLQSDWKPMLNKLAGSLNKVVHPVKNDKGEKWFDFEFTFDKPEMKDGLEQHLLDIALDFEADINEDNIKKLGGISESYLFEKNRSLIFDEYAKELVTRMRDEFHKESHNPSPLTGQTRPTTGQDNPAQDNETKIGNVLKL